MSESAFDPNDLFDVVSENWVKLVDPKRDFKSGKPRPNPAAAARAAFLEFVIDESWWEDWAKPLLTDPANYGNVHGPSMLGHLRALLRSHTDHPSNKKRQATTPSAAASAVEVETTGKGLYGSADSMTAAAREAFEKVAGAEGFWPQNARFRETQESKEAAWRQAAQKYPLEEVVAVCAFYADHFNDPSHGMVYAYHLKNFLTRDSLYEEWRSRWAFAPTPEETSAFIRTWDRYPSFPGKEMPKARNDAMAFYVRHVSTEELRLGFLCAVEAYREERRNHERQEDERYTLGFVRFCGDWAALQKIEPRKMPPREREALARYLAAPFLPQVLPLVLPQYREVVGPDFLEAHIQNVSLEAPLLPTEALTAAWRAATGQEPGLERVARILSQALRAAGLLPETSCP